ncbi:MAG: DNA polymerase III subunit delta [Chloroflexota bacterium]|nr:DNA polymerase III subunit delta [Chloroflexota bacterium]
MSAGSAPVAYFAGEDAYGIERAVRELASALGTDGAPLVIWRTGADEDGAGDDAAGTAARRRDRLLGEIEQRLATAPLFGGGTLVVVRQPSGLLREGNARARLMALIPGVPPGNGLCLCELASSSGAPSATAREVRDAVTAAGGVTRDFPVPTRERMEAWIVARARELDISMGQGAARLLAERVGAYVRESDVDRRRQTQLVDGELQKLSLFRPGSTVSREDIADLVAEAVPGSAWAFLDAVGSRRLPDAAKLAERLVADSVPIQVLVAQLHRRLRELVIVREHIDSGIRGGALVREMKVQPFRAQKLEEQARQWSAGGLTTALDGLLELDLASKGIALDGSTRQASESRTSLHFLQWLAESLGR